MQNKNTLHLTLKKQWFDMIKSGEKKEEYREIKPYWTTRLEGKQFDKICFHNGYKKNSPYMLVECLGIQKDMGLMTWGAEQDTEYYVIQLGDLLIVDDVQIKDRNGVD